MGQIDDLSDEVKADIADKINSEGFDYYFSEYGADERLEELFGKEIEEFVRSRKVLQSALLKAGFEIEY